MIIDLQAKQEHDALLALGRSQQKLLDQQNQLQQLYNYQTEYQDKILIKEQSGLSISEFLEFRAFADKLQQAIKNQVSAVSSQELELMNVRKHWEQAHQRTLSLQKIKQQAQLNALKLENKFEQQEQDLHAARLYRLNNRS